MDAIWPYLAALIPTVVVATFFYFIIKRMMEADRRERLAQSKFEAEQDRRRAAAERGPAARESDEGHLESPSETGENPRGNAKDS